MDFHEDSDLLVFLRNNDVEELQWFVHTEGAERVVNADLTGSGITPLHYLCDRGHNQCVELLLRTGAIGNVNAPDGLGRAPLHLACQDKEALDVGRKCVALLLEYGADVGVRSDDHATPLHDACDRGGDDCATLLLKAGADVNATCEGGLTPLHVACEHGRVDCVELLLQWGAHTSACDDHGRAPLSLACAGGAVDCVGLMLQAGALSGSPAQHERVPPLQFAVWNGNECMRLVLKAVGCREETRVLGQKARRERQVVRMKEFTEGSDQGRLPFVWTQGMPCFLFEDEERAEEDQERADVECALRALLLAEARRAGCELSEDATTEVLRAVKRCDGEEDMDGRDD
jgi:ankyrin repeat protein